MKQKTINVALPESLHKRLKSAAKVNSQTVQFHLANAVREYLAKGIEKIKAA